MHRGRPVDPTSDRAVYRQVADHLRDDIRAGRLAPGAILPSQTHLQQEYEVGRETIRNALRALQGEGLVETVPGVGTRVRAHRERRRVTPDPGSDVDARMPTEEERKALGMSEGSPVFVVQLDGEERLLAADRTTIRMPIDGR